MIQPVVGDFQFLGDADQRPRLAVEHGGQGRALDDADLRALRPGVPRVEERVVLETGLECIGPFGQAVSVAVVCGREPCAEEGQQPGVGIRQEGAVPRGPVRLPCQRGQKRRGLEFAELPADAGLAVDLAVDVLHRQEVLHKTLEQMRRAGQQCGEVIRIERRLAIPQKGVVEPIAAARESLVGVAGEHEGGAGQVLPAGEEESEGSLLGEGKGGVPIGVAGGDVHRLVAVDDLDAASFPVPGAGGGAAGGFKGGLVVAQRGVHPGQGARGARQQVEAQQQRGVGSRAGLRTAGDEDHWGEVLRLAGQHGHRLHLHRRQRLPVDGDELPDPFELDRVGADVAVGDGQPAGHDLRGGDPVFGVDVHALERGKGQREKVGINTVGDGRRGELRRVNDGSAFLGEAGKQAHGPGAQPVGGAQGEGRAVLRWLCRAPRSGR